MHASVHRRLARRERRILRRIGHQPGAERPEPMMAASNIRYEIAETVRGIARASAHLNVDTKGFRLTVLCESRRLRRPGGGSGTASDTQETQDLPHSLAVAPC